MNAAQQQAGADRLRRPLSVRVRRLDRLQVGEVRVFYDVTTEVVEVLAIVTKAEAAAWLAARGTPDPPGGTR